MEKEMKKIVLLNFFLVMLSILLFGCLSMTESNTPAVNTSSKPSTQKQVASPPQAVVKQEPTAEELASQKNELYKQYENRFPSKDQYPKMSTIDIQLAMMGWNDGKVHNLIRKTTQKILKMENNNGFIIFETDTNYDVNNIKNHYGLENNKDFQGINIGDIVTLYTFYVYDGKSLESFVTGCDLLDRSTALEWQNDSVVYKKVPLQEALRIVRNEGSSNNKYNFWSRDIDFSYYGGYFTLSSGGTTEIHLVEYYGDDLKSNSGHGSVLYTIDCSGIIPKVTAVKFIIF